jgi:large subunit ribosomal protein L25
MENFKLNSELRDGAGKGVSRRFRSTGRVPAVLYGHKKDVLSLTLDEAEIRAILHAHPDSAIVGLTVAAGAEVNALVREVQRHPASGKLLHIDLQRISLDEKVRVDVEVVLIGDPVGVKEQGGMLEHGTRSVTVMCLPREIPASIEIEVAAMKIGDSVKIKDVLGKYPKLEFVDDAEATLAAVVPPRVELKPGEGEAEAAAPAEPEVIKREGAEAKPESE